MKMPSPLARKMSPREMAALLAPPTTAMLRMRLGTAAEEDRHTLAVCINVGHIIASRVQRHNEHAPDMLRGAAAANDGWRDLDAVDGAVELFKAMARTTNRKTLLAAYTQAVDESSSDPNDRAIPCDPIPRREVPTRPLGD